MTSSDVSHLSKSNVVHEARYPNEPNARRQGPNSFYWKNSDVESFTLLHKNTRSPENKCCLVIPGKRFHIMTSSCYIMAFTLLQYIGDKDQFRKWFKWFILQQYHALIIVLMVQSIDTFEPIAAGMTHTQLLWWFHTQGQHLFCFL